MKKFNFDVVISFVNLPEYKTTVPAINGYQATQQALKEHRIKTGCSTNEMYNSCNTTFQQVNWTPVN